MKEWLRKFQCSHEWIILHITRYETCDKLLLTCKIWYVNANMGVKEPYTEKQLVRLWSNYWREITYDNAK